MGISERERRRRKFEELLEEGQLSKADAAAMLHSSKERVTTWLRKEGAAGAYPVPEWAIELLRFKIDALKLETAKK